MDAIPNARVLVAAVLQNQRGEVLFSSHEPDFREHFPDTEPRPNETLREALNRGLMEDFSIGPFDFPIEPFVTERVNSATGIRTITLHYRGVGQCPIAVVSNSKVKCVWRNLRTEDLHNPYDSTIQATHNLQSVLSDRKL